MQSLIWLMRIAVLKLVLGISFFSRRCLLILVCHPDLILVNHMVRIEGGIPPLVELLEFIDTKVQRAAAGALRTLAFKNDENKNQVDE